MSDQAKKKEFIRQYMRKLECFQREAIAMSSGPPDVKWTSQMDTRQEKSGFF